MSIRYKFALALPLETEAVFVYRPCAEDGAPATRRECSVKGDAAGHARRQAGCLDRPPRARAAGGGRGGRCDSARHYVTSPARVHLRNRRRTTCNNQNNLLVVSRNAANGMMTVALTAPSAAGGYLARAVGELPGRSGEQWNSEKRVYFYDFCFVYLYVFREYVVTRCRSSIATP
ncbi:hypothetical protein EVAR_75268_1 [Eumeta japonica]|uniref:Uncharacterized protein n=1 Tax=Eumeta variegata TaxID=151549 RepID=A0A4C1VBT4_EUMVA|nr:hypothetical protein EVAR_75268_1 [Eumeta japonica]